MGADGLGVRLIDPLGGRLARDGLDLDAGARDVDAGCELHEGALLDGLRPNLARDLGVGDYVGGVAGNVSVADGHDAPLPWLAQNRVDGFAEELGCCL